jgi:DNA-binding CsgD family transcriptional regulator/tetratricopeptide (TPR) repeat protein
LMVGRISSPRFVGRERELEALERLVARAAGGSGGAVVVAGEAGIGKSRLIAELEERSRAGVRMLVGECIQLAEGELAFLPMISALREVMEDGAVLAGLSDPVRSVLAALWPIPDAGAAAGGREQLFEAVYRVLARVAQAQAVLLVVEDAHWMDPSSRDLLAFLMRNARNDRIAFVLTYRPDELHRGHPSRPFLAELERSGHAQRVELQAFDRAEAAEQLAAIGGRMPSAIVVDRIFARSEGNPFFAEELLASPGSGSELPGSLREALLLRVERLSPVAREVLRAAAVTGRSVDHRLLAEVVGLAEAELSGALREAMDHHVLLPSTGGVAYAFRHALLREAIYDDTLAGERLRLHRAIAETLASHGEYAGPVPRAALAHHWAAAGDDRAALAALLEAATEAESMRAYGEGLAHLERALMIWDRVEAAEDHAGCDLIGLLLRASQLGDRAGDSDRALALAERARGRLDEGTEPLRVALAEQRIGQAMHHAGRSDDAVEHLTAARRLVRRDPPSLAYARALSAEARALMLSGRSPEAQALLDEAQPLAERLEAPAVHADLLATATCVYGELGQRERAIAAGRSALRIAEAIGAGEEMARAYVNGSQALDDAGRIEQALAMGVEGIAAVDQRGMGRVVGDQLREQAAWRLQRIGRLAEAERMIEPALQNATTPFNIAAAHCFAGRVAVERGDLDLAESRLERAWALMQRSGRFQLIGPAMAARVLLAIRRRDLGRARQRAQEGLERVVGAQGDLLYNAELYWLAARVEAELAERARMIGDGRASQLCEQAMVAVLSQFDRAIDRTPGDGAPPESLAFRALLVAELSRTQGELDAGPWRAAAERFRAIGAVYPAAYAELRAVESLVLVGTRPSEIARPLKAVYAVALEVGSPPFLDEVLSMGRRTGVSLDPTRESESDAATEFGLTAREFEVLRLLADGRTNRQIGQELFITAKTASVHVSRILTKLHAANRAEAVAAAHRLGVAQL